MQDDANDADTQTDDLRAKDRGDREVDSEGGLVGIDVVPVAGQDRAESRTAGQPKGRWYLLFIRYCTTTTIIELLINGVGND